MLLQGYIFGWLLKWGEVIGAIGSLILSALLVGLYHQQHKVLRLEQEPLIEVGDCDKDGNEISAYVSNYGKGVAKNMRLRTTVEFPKDDERNLLSDDRDPDRINTRSIEHSIQRCEDGEKIQERAISGGERGVEFSGRPPFPAPEGQAYGDFTSGVGEAFRNEHYEFNFWVEIVCEDEFGETITEPLFTPGRWIDIDPEEGKRLFEQHPNKITFEEVYNRGGFAPRRN
ncbi:hypothetical protein [Haloarcula salinisoli]|uniref:Uncharacterized protein n=1 Tax=Haloarcula salinisoli TaxID=2487746 RepID=A0A8J7YL15_9EURY|nr:hypothetical protein [Halomicroarcula salinisoli]MBX0305281.1 hypothetical protein [Halomicroarcula salinisoli]